MKYILYLYRVVKKKQFKTNTIMEQKLLLQFKEQCEAAKNLTGSAGERREKKCLAVYLFLLRAGFDDNTLCDILEANNM